MNCFQEKITNRETAKCADSAVCQRQAGSFAAMYSMHKQGELCDATLGVDGEEIKVHKASIHSKKNCVILGDVKSFQVRLIVCLFVEQILRTSR